MKFLVFILTLAALLAGCGQSTEAEKDLLIRTLQETIQAQQQQIEIYKGIIAEQQANDQKVFVHDLFGFVESGTLLLLGEAELVQTSNVFTREGVFLRTESLYEVVGSSLLIRGSEGGDVEIPISMGETITLTTLHIGDQGYIAYYSCYTNSTACTVRDQNTWIPLREGFQPQ